MSKVDNVDNARMIVVATHDKETVDSCHTEFCHLKPGRLSFVVIALHTNVQFSRMENIKS